MKTVDIRHARIGPGQPLAIIGGPCAAESLELCLQVGEALRDKCGELGLGFIFKASYDKANRTSIKSERGPGVAEGLKILERVGRTLDVPLTTDIHEPDHAALAAEVVDLLQIPAFLCRQTDILVAAAGTGRPVNIKKGQFLSPPEMKNVVGKLVEVGAGESGILLTERGTFFGYNRLVNDFVGLGDLMELGWPVCFDVTHSTQQPGAGTTSGGRPERAPLLARCAVAAGVQALFLETHSDPSNAVSDGATMLPIESATELLTTVARLRDAVGF